MCWRGVDEYGWQSLETPSRGEARSRIYLNGGGCGCAFWETVE